MTIDDLIDQYEDVEVPSWAKWKIIAQNHDIRVLDDDSGFNDSQEVTHEEAREGLKKCTVQILSTNGSERISKWTEEYDKLIKNPPEPDTILTAQNGKVKLDVTKELGKLPFISTRAYVPDLVGSPLGWFVTGEGEVRTHGFRVILGAKSREAAIRRFGLSGNEMFVNSLRVLRLSFDKNSIVAEIKDWD